MKLNDTKCKNAKPLDVLSKALSKLTDAPPKRCCPYPPKVLYFPPSSKKSFGLCPILFIYLISAL